MTTAAVSADPVTRRTIDVPHRLSFEHTVIPISCSEPSNAEKFYSVADDITTPCYTTDAPLRLDSESEEGALSLAELRVLPEGIARRQNLYCNLNNSRLYAHHRAKMNSSKFGLAVEQLGIGRPRKTPRGGPTSVLGTYDIGDDRDGGHSNGSSVCIGHQVRTGHIHADAALGIDKQHFIVSRRSELGTISGTRNMAPERGVVAHPFQMYPRLPFHIVRRDVSSSMRRDPTYCDTIDAVFPDATSPSYSLDRVDEETPLLQQEISSRKASVLSRRERAAKKTNFFSICRSSVRKIFGKS